MEGMIREGPLHLPNGQHEKRLEDGEKFTVSFSASNQTSVRANKQGIKKIGFLLSFHANNPLLRFWNIAYFYLYNVCM